MSLWGAVDGALTDGRTHASASPTTLALRNDSLRAVGVPHARLLCAPAGRSRAAANTAGTGLYEWMRETTRAATGSVLVHSRSGRSDTVTRCLCAVCNGHARGGPGGLGDCAQSRRPFVADCAPGFVTFTVLMALLAEAGSRASVAGAWVSTRHASGIMRVTPTFVTVEVPEP